MDSVNMTPGNYDGSYKFISGGEISLDFINTISWPGTSKEHDWFDQPENVSAWAVAAGIISEDIRFKLDNKPKTKLAKELSQVHNIRRNLTLILRPLSLGEQPESPAFEVLNELIHIAMRHRYLTNEFQWVWDDPQTLYEILYPVIWNAAHVLTNLDHTRIGHCTSCKCVFYDTTRNRSRKWCDMEDCGSLHKALRYYHRTKSGNDHKIE